MDNLYNFIGNYMPYIMIAFFVFIFGLAIYAIVKNGSDRKKLKETTLPRRFKYLDTFYFIDSSGEDSETVAYNLIQDRTNDKMYLILVSQFENCYFIGYKEPRLVTGKNGFTSKMPKVEFNQEGNFWVKKEEPSQLVIEDGMIKLHLEQSFVKTDLKLIIDKNQITSMKYKFYPELFHINESYDYSILEQATIIYGVAEFDNYYNN